MTEQEWERRMRDRGRTRLIERTRKIELAGHESDTAWGLNLRREKNEALAHEIEKERALGGKSTLARFLRETPLNAAQIADRVITVALWNTQLGRPVTVTQAVIKLGQELERDARWALKEAGEPQPLPWDEEDGLHIGAELFGIMRRTVGIVDGAKFRDRDDAHPTLYLTTDETTQEYRKDTLASTQCPQWMPMIEPPQPWNAHGLRGGYLDADHEFNLSLVLPNEHAVAVPSPHVIEAVNLVQATAWRINTRVLDVMEHVWSQQRRVGKLPDNVKQEPYHLVNKLKASTTREKHQVYEGYLKHLGREGKRKAAEATLTVATECRAFERIYFPHRVDFTGRMYPVPEHLTPQGPDYAKALLTFAEGQPIAPGPGAASLAVHGANLWGAKGSFEGRHRWVYHHDAEILECAANPMDHGWWRKAAKPWQFLAFCFEWQGLDKAEREGQPFVSCLPVAMDGTCNGLQHYAAMMRDLKSAAATNLTAPVTEVVSAEEQDVALEANEGPLSLFDERGDRVVAPPQDLYQHVAEEVVAEIQKSRKLLVDGTEIDEDDALKLRALAASGQMSRKMMKSHVMTLPYGKTPHGRRLTLEEYLTDPDESGTAEPLWEDVPSDVLTYLSSLITKSIEKHVPAAKDAMEWLHEIAELLAKAKQPVTWATPSGLQITQHYRDISTRQVEMRARNSIMGKPFKLTLSKHEVDDPMDTRSQMSAFAPNFVHSYDAAHLAETVLLAKGRGVASFAMVHDSYATTAAQTDTLAEALRHAFVDLYTQHAPLVDLRDRAVVALGSEAKLQAMPKTGSLDLTTVRESRYFFA